jgi:hypothetical protein
MNPLIYAAMVLAVAAIVVTVYALLSAGDGYEDENGFHSVRAARVPNACPPDDTNEESSIPPYLPAH